MYNLLGLCIVCWGLAVPNPIQYTKFTKYELKNPKSRLVRNWSEILISRICLSIFGVFPDRQKYALGVEHEDIQKATEVCPELSYEPDWRPKRQLSSHEPQEGPPQENRQGKGPILIINMNTFCISICRFSN